MRNSNVTSFTRTVMELDRAINKYYFQIFKQWGLTANGYLALYTLHKSPRGMEPACLADELGVQRQLVTALINDFDRRGFIVKKENNKDHRRKFISLSRRGKLFTKDVMDHVLAADAEALSGFSQEELDRMMDFCRRYYERLPKIQ
ncbi:MAG: MarR family transcriptional regulator [Planctomycetia bacterium]|nr:MarR family transcriptional regulator [Planctomycetia bacterium]